MNSQPEYLRYRKVIKKNNSMKFYFTLFCILILQTLNAQNNFRIDIVHQNVNTSLRGLSVVNDSVIWVSGSKGYVGISTDAGLHWNFKQIHPYDSAEFRDIEAFDANTAIVMSSVQPACIIKTTDGGINWKEVYRDNRPEAFLDGMDFNSENAVCIGDPIGNTFLTLYSFDKGESWNVADEKKQPQAKKDMAAFAASGTCIQILKNNTIVFGTGGNFPGLIQYKFNKKHFNSYQLPLDTVGASIGIFSLYFSDKKNGFIVVGDYTKPADSSDVFYATKNGGKSWHKAQKSPGGYRSCITQISDNMLICCGTSGVDIAMINGNIKWQNVGMDGYNSVQKAKSGFAVYLVGNDGKVGKLVQE